VQYWPVFGAVAYDLGQEVIMIRSVLFGAALTATVSLSACGDGNQELILGATTSVQDTELLDVLVEEFEARYAYEVKPIVAGSGQVVGLPRQGELDVIMTHSPKDEESLVLDGYGIDRTPVMQNYFLVVGPEDDPAGVSGASDMTDALKRIAGSESVFISRGDGSGTHKRELELWGQAGIDPAGQGWYAESATGQGQNLTLADDRGAYTIVDSSTFVAFTEHLALKELLRDEKRPNVYSVVRLDPEKLGMVNGEAGDAWLEFMTGAGQEIVAEFGAEEFGEPLFEPLAR
jgi:tungstate transport system substrate-binding protein